MGRGSDIPATKARSNGIGNEYEKVCNSYYWLLVSIVSSAVLSQQILLTNYYAHNAARDEVDDVDYCISNTKKKAFATIFVS